MLRGKKKMPCLQNLPSTPRYIQQQLCLYVVGVCEIHESVSAQTSTITTLSTSRSETPPTHLYSCHNHYNPVWRCIWPSALCRLNPCVIKAKVFTTTIHNSGCVGSCCRYSDRRAHSSHQIQRLMACWWSCWAVRVSTAASIAIPS